MNGSLALLIALISYGNNYIIYGAEIPKLDFNNSTLIYCNMLNFYNNALAIKSDIVAQSPQEWFKFLKKDGCRKLRIYYTHSNEIESKDFESAGFVGGGGDWLIEAVYANHSNYWVLTESVINQNAPDNRIWESNFTVRKNKPSTSKLISIEIAKKNLSVALNKITLFAAENNLKGWATEFENANKNLDNPQPHVEYYDDFVFKDQLSLSAKQLLFSASLSYVFGGMGSWNDNLFSSPEKEKLNTELTSKLYDGVNEAIVSALNNR